MRAYSKANLLVQEAAMPDCLYSRLPFAKTPATENLDKLRADRLQTSLEKIQTLPIQSIIHRDGQVQKGIKAFA